MSKLNSTTNFALKIAIDLDVKQSCTHVTSNSQQINWQHENKSQGKTFRSKQSEYYGSLWQWHVNKKIS